MDSKGSDIFRRYLQEAIGHENAAVAFSALEEPASVSVRNNPEKMFQLSYPVSAGVPWCPDGCFLSERPVFTLDPGFHAGAYYVQDSSSMFVGHIFRKLLAGIEQRKVVRVLDLCAAPGGKTTDLAASLRRVFGNDFVLVSNEVMKQRSQILADNVALWGDPCVVVTSNDPAHFTSLNGYFDIILADVPCSGEGMFRKDEKAVELWSEDNVKLCQSRQKRILADVWPALADGGVLIYSTCTFNKFENDYNVRWASEELGAEFLFDGEVSEGLGFDGVLKTKYGFSLVPGFVRGEGQYCSALRKTGGSPRLDVIPRKGKDKSSPKDKLSLQEASRVSELFDIPVSVVKKGDMLKMIPDSIAQDVSFLEGKLHVVASGCVAGVMKNGVLVPDADMALCILFKKGAFPVADVDIDTALSFLKGNQITLPGDGRGYFLITYCGLPLGFVKKLDNRCNNLHPKGRRIRMEIR